MKLRSIIGILIVAWLVCGVLPVSVGAYVVADGADKSYAAAAEAMVLLKTRITRFRSHRPTRSQFLAMVRFTPMEKPAAFS